MAVRGWSRTRVAEDVGVSLTSVRRFEKRGWLHYRLDPDGVHIFDPKEVEALKARLRRRRSPSKPPEKNNDGVIAARIVTLLREGKSTADVVAVTKQSFEYVRQVRTEIEGEGALSLTRAEVRELEEEGFAGDGKLTGEIIVKTMKGQLSENRRVTNMEFAARRKIAELEKRSAELEKKIAELQKNQTANDSDPPSSRRRPA